MRGNTAAMLILDFVFAVMFGLCLCVLVFVILPEFQKRRDIEGPPLLPDHRLLRRD
jgi:ABC-type methionine transport system permease subunit